MRPPASSALLLFLAVLLAAPGRSTGRDFPTWLGERARARGAAADDLEQAAAVVASRRYPVAAVLEVPYPCALRRFPVVRGFIETRAKYL